MTRRAAASRRAARARRRAWTRASLIRGLLCVALWGCGSAALQLDAAPRTHPDHEHDAQQGDRATSKHRFEDAAYWSSVFDAPERDAWQRPERLVELLALRPGDAVADIGAGTGYLNRRLARAVGPTGSVFAVDVEPNLVAFMRDRAEREQTPNVIPVLGSFDEPRLPAAALDLILLLDTYHHIDHRRSYFRRLRSRLKPGGRVVVVDFHKRELPVGPPPAHKLDPGPVIEEMQAAGFELKRRYLVSLPHQYVLVFSAPAP